MWRVVLLVLCLAACTAADSPPWWSTAVFYQVYPRSFKDSDGDGVGDLKGIAQSADYFKTIGVDAIWMSPIFQSPMVDSGYDISDFTAIDPMFGSMEDFDELVTTLKRIGVRLVLDFVPNHTSEKHEWFQRSVNPADPLHEDYKDFYVWRDPKYNETTSEHLPPNNWKSVFGGSAWEWSSKRNQYYLHIFAKAQPDLNYRCKSVVGNMTAILNFWLDKGIDGLRIDAVPHIVENDTFPDEPVVPGTAGDTFDTLEHIYETNQPETYELMYYWADLLKNLTKKDGVPRAMFLEAVTVVAATMKYYDTSDPSVIIPFNFNLEGIRQYCTSNDIKNLVDLWMDNMPRNGVANWMTGNHDNPRISSRAGPQMVDAVNLLTGVLPGVGCVYYGQELGMLDTYVRWDQVRDPSTLRMGPQALSSTRDVARTPMQWDDSSNAGFTSNSTPWLPVNPNYWWLNVKNQLNVSGSHLSVFQAMAEARKDPVLQRGDLRVLSPDNDTLVVVRNYSAAYFILIVNSGSLTATYTSGDFFAANGLDMDMTVRAASGNSGYLQGTNLKKGLLSVTLRPKAAVLLRSGSSPQPTPSPTPSPSLSSSPSPSPTPSSSTEPHLHTSFIPLALVACILFRI